MIGDVYYVGEYVSSHLITSEQGHILIDTGYPESGPFILKSIIDVGFNPKDIKYILLTHAHFDHTGSARMLIEETGAKVCIGEADVEACEKGNTRPGRAQPPFKTDISLKDGDVITLGDKEIKVYHTPGHTVGDISFGFKIVHEDHVYDAFLSGFAATGMGDKVQEGYEGALQDYKETVDRLEPLKVDVWLASHPETNDTFGKLELLRKRVTPNPYIDPEGWKAFLRIIKNSLTSGKAVGPWNLPLYTRLRPYFMKN